MNHLGTSSLALLGVLALSGAAAGGEKAKRLCDFEGPDDLKAWEVVAGEPLLVSEGASHGTKAMQIRFDPKGRYYPAYMTWRRVRRNWSGFDALVLDVLNPGPQPIPGYVLIADEAWRKKGGSYWNRHNASTTFAPGRRRWVISVGGLYRGEAGSRNNDIKRNIDVDSIVRVDFGFGRRGSMGRAVVDNLRLIKIDRPAGAWAFDFGPPDQSVMPGWTGVSHATAYTTARGFGWGPVGGTPWNGAARDTTFGPALLRDFCEAGGYRFRVDVPAGKYRATVIYENSGYWGGEQAMHTWRRILANGREAWKETRADGPAHALYRFEDVDPVGVDLWDTYMKPELARPIAFEAQAGKDGLTLKFETDRPWGSRLAALVIHGAEDEAAAGWLAGQLDALAVEFRSWAVALDDPPGRMELPDAWKALGYVAWPVKIEQDVTPGCLPPQDAKDPGELALSRLAARGEGEAFCLALRPGRHLGRCGVRFEWVQGPGELPAELFAVWYNTGRGFNSIAYYIMPHTLRKASEINLAKDVTRELIAIVRVPDDAAAGEYSGRIVVQGEEGAVLRVPVRLKVSAVRLDRQTEFRMGFFGLMPPRLVGEERRWQILDRTLAMLREHGMNMVSGGPSWRLKGWKDGAPIVDFGEMDRFFALLRKHGFTGPLNGYGGARFLGLHDRYRKGQTGQKVERESGLPYAEALMRAWRAVDKHARGNRWPTIWYAMCDETRVRDVAERELAFMEMMAKVSAAFSQTVRTSGGYSVSFSRRPADKEDLLYWHRRFFGALDISDLNRHDPTVLAEARRLGKQVHIYNQGRTRYSFGLYQWSEFRKGVRARTQWHLNVLHGYQFFDLDGREPDHGMICYGRKGLYPTIHFERCREGAEDFYLYNTLWRLVERRRQVGAKSAALEVGASLLKELVAGIQLNQRRPPEGFDADKLKARVVSAIEAIGQQ